MQQTPDDFQNTDRFPDLLPQREDAPEDWPDETPEEATVVRRPKKRRRRWYHVVLRITLFLLKIVLGLVVSAAIAAAGLIGYLTMTEYNPSHAENAQFGSYTADETLNKTTIRVLTLNTGYAGLGEDADFFMDGGKGVRTADRAKVEENMKGISAVLRRSGADFILLQEVDTDSKRTYRLNQWNYYEQALRRYESRFALNYSCQYVPYPLSERIGRVNSGLVTLSRYDISSATRYALPCPFSWPVRVANLKRCLLLSRIPIDGSDKELVLVNLHLEAYDDGEGKAEQTEALLELLQAEYEKGNYVVAAGDFNQLFPRTEDTYPIKSTSDWTPGTLGSAPAGWRYAFDKSTPTCRLLNEPYSPRSAKTQYYVIDGFLLSPNVRLESVETLDQGFGYTDHNPVIAELTLE